MGKHFTSLRGYLEASAALISRTVEALDPMRAERAIGVEAARADAAGSVE